MRKTILTIFCSLFFISLLAQQRNFWKPVNESTVGRDLFAQSNTERPVAYKIFQLDETSFKTSMASAPSEKIISASRSSFIISFPMPDGSIKQFRVVDAPVMAPELANEPSHDCGIAERGGGPTCAIGSPLRRTRIGFFVRFTLARIAKQVALK